MKQKLLLFAFTMLNAILYSQSQNLAFEEFRSSEGTQNFFYKNVVKTDASGNIYTLGATTTSNSTTDILLSKKNSSGVTLWTKQINGTANYHDFGAGMVITSGGDVYITGAITNNTTTLNPDLIVRKYNSSGTQQFSSTYSNGYGDVGKDIVVDGSGNSYITGASYNSGFSADIILISYNSSGTQRWVNFFDYVGLNEGGVKIGTKSGNVTITGGVTVSSNNYKIATLTANASTGVLSETVTLGSTMTSSVEIVTDMVQDASGNTYLCGAYEVSGQGYNYYLAKLTSSLTIAWEQTYNSPSNLNDVAEAVKVDGSGNVYVTGVSTSSVQGKDIRTIKYNSSGTLQWNVVENSTSNGDDEGFDMEMDNSSNIYVCGSISSDLDQKNYYTIKYNSSGTKIWEIQSDGIHLNDKATNMALDSLDNVIVTGESETAPGTYVYTTYKYIQRDVITPTDFNGEIPDNNRLYYPNKGQLINTGDTLVPEIKYYTNNTNPLFYFKNKTQSYVFSHIDTVAANNDTLHRIDLKFTNSAELAKVYPMDEHRTDYLNYYLAHTPSEGVTNVYGNKRLITPDLYPNIDLMSSSNQSGIKYYFIVKPGGDMRDIKLEFTGATSFSLNGTTNALSINSSIGSITFDKPVAYQLTAGNATVAVTSFSPTWTTDGASNKYKFNDGAYTASLTLVIQVDQGNVTNSASAINDIDWSTFYSSTGYEDFGSVSTDRKGNVNVAGTTNSSNFPTLGSNVLIYGGSDDAVVVRFNKNGVRQWATTYGGATAESTKSAVMDTIGNYFITGKTDGLIPFPFTQPSGAFVDNTPNGGSDVYIAKFDTLGKLRWATLYGSNGSASGDNVYEIDMDKSGNLVIVGSHNNVGTFPTYYKANAFYNTVGRGFIVKFNSSLQLNWATKFGRTKYNWGDVFAVEFDEADDMYITGWTIDSLDTRFLAGAANDTTYNGSMDGYLAMFNHNQDSLVWSTYIGGSGYDYGYKLKNANRNIYLAGYANSGNFPLKHSNQQYFDTISGTLKNFIMRFSIVDKKLKWSTGFTGNVNSMCRDSKGNIAIAGSATGSIPTMQNTGSYWQSSISGGGDAHVTFFNQLDTLIYSTYVGGSLSDGYASVASYNDHVYFVGGSKSGQSASTVFPLANLGGTPPAWWGPTINNTQGYGTAVITRFNFSNTLYVGVNELNKIDNKNGIVSVFPNPSSGLVYLKFNSDVNEKIIIEIYDIMGRNMYLKSFNNINENQLESLNLSNYTNGMYLIKISSSKHQECIKIIKEQ